MAASSGWEFPGALKRGLSPYGTCPAGHRNGRGGRSIHDAGARFGNWLADVRISELGYGTSKKMLRVPNHRSNDVMSKRKSARPRRKSATRPSRAAKKAVQRASTSKRKVDSLLDAMQDGKEYGSLVDLVPKRDDSLIPDIRRAMAEIEAIRERPLIIYAANFLKPPAGAPVEISSQDDLPFAEMIDSVPAEQKRADVLVVTPGGSGQQVAQFVVRLRPRFEHVSFIIPSMAMSAGTIWALSGDEIWMDERGFIGPIDPQIPGKDGRLIPAQALLRLLDEIQDEGQKALDKGRQPRWTNIQLLKSIDAKEIGNTIAQTEYAIQLAAEYLEKYKFRNWITRKTSGVAVTPEYRATRAREIAEKLCSHEVWKIHSHGISRDVAKQILQLEIGHPDTVNGFERAIRRLWALLYWIYDRSAVAKIFLSQHYTLARLGSGGGK